jgi:hypothetical protein
MTLEDIADIEAQLLCLRSIADTAVKAGDKVHHFCVRLNLNVI